MTLTPTAGDGRWLPRRPATQPTERDRFLNVTLRYVPRNHRLSRSAATRSGFRTAEQSETRPQNNVQGYSPDQLLGRNRACSGTRASLARLARTERPTATA